MMQAVAFSRYGEADVLETSQVAVPSVQPDEVQVRVIAAGVNPADWVLRRGQLRLVARLKFPFVPGSDIAGVVEAVGTQVAGFRPGDAVYAMLPTLTGGGYAEYAVVKDTHLARIPAGIRFAEAAAVPLAALTALQALRDKAAIAPGQDVLIYGASGGVGSFAVQIARALGVTVTAVCSTRNIDMVQQLGAEHVVDYTTQDVTHLPRQYDAVLDAVGLLPYRVWKRVVKPSGVVVTVNPTQGNPLAKAWARLTSSSRLAAVFVQPSGDDLRQLAAWISAGQVRPVIDRCYPLAETAEAHRYSESRRARGKLVILLDPAQAEEHAT